MLDLTHYIVCRVCGTSITFDQIDNAGRGPCCKDAPLLTEDEMAFGKDAWIYCSQHMRPHETGWCSVSPRDKVGLGVATAEDAYQKCRDWGFPLFRECHTARKEPHDA
jgi:hypothetical protein